MLLYQEIKEKLDLVEANNKKAKKILDSVSKLGGKFSLFRFFCTRN